jgi:hypothetical protein
LSATWILRRRARLQVTWLQFLEVLARWPWPCCWRTQWTVPRGV